MPVAVNDQDVENFIVFGSLNTFRYTNWKGETEMRRVIPHCLRFGSSEHHFPMATCPTCRGVKGFCLDPDKPGVVTLSCDDCRGSGQIPANDPSVRAEDQGGGIWLLECYDCDKMAPRTFALKDIHPR